MNEQVYLAGKVTKNGWREPICHPRGVISAEADNAELYRWPLTASLVLGVLITGPYGVSCDHGCFHGRNTHGFGESTCCIGTGDIQQQGVFTACMDAIRRSSSVFAWIDAKDCYGTLIELGYAKALSKYIYVAVAPAVMEGFGVMISAS